MVLVLFHKQYKLTVDIKPNWRFQLARDDTVCLALQHDSLFEWMVVRFVSVNLLPT